MVNLLDLRSTERHISELPQWVRALLIRINWEYSSLQSNTVNPQQPRCIEVPGKGHFACLSPSFMLMSESFLWLLLLPSPLPLWCGLKTKGFRGVLHALSTALGLVSLSSLMDGAVPRFSTSPQETHVAGLPSCYHVSHSNKSSFAKHICSLNFVSLENPKWYMYINVCVYVCIET